tara:strand:- start:731 stop:1132 length:402 start_codon:yes stop_codon:yes gene_type:complete
MRKILSIAIVSSCLFGFKIPMYSAYLGKAYAENAKLCIRIIFEQSKIYVSEHGEFPSTLDDMIDADYLFLESEMRKGWEFEMNIEYNEMHDMEGYIVAYSNEEMPDGAGEIILLDVKTLQFCGYAQKFDCRLD